MKEQKVTDLTTFANCYKHIEMLEQRIVEMGMMVKSAQENLIRLLRQRDDAREAVRVVIKQIQPEFQPMVVVNAIVDRPDLRNEIEGAWPEKLKPPRERTSFEIFVDDELPDLMRDIEEDEP